MMAAGIARSWDERRAERQLLIGCLLCVSIGFLLVLGSRHGEGGQLEWRDLLPLAIYGLSLSGMHLALVGTRFRGDQVLVAATAFLAGFGLLAQSRMGAFQSSHGTATLYYVFPAGVLIMVAVTAAFMRGRYRALARGMWLWGGVSIALVALLLATGQRFRGGVYAAGFFTPTELLKVTVVLFAAAYVERFARDLGRWGHHGLVPPWRELLPLAGVFTTLIVLLMLQRDLGMVVILSITLIAMLALGTGRTGYLAYGIAAALALGWVVLEVFQHGQRRIQAWQSPFQDPTGDGWQILQGLSAMHSGGLWGEGFGQGNPEYTPIAESDFIYSVIGEELGFLGCVIVVAFFLLFFYRGLQITYRSRSPFGGLLCGGLTTILAAQTVLNIGGVTKFLPLTGITLPFISHGGSSLLTAFTALGLMLAVSDGEATAGRRTHSRGQSRGTAGRETPRQQDAKQRLRAADSRRKC
jgi:cell division protein FtsW (lipid II flippase)